MRMFSRTASVLLSCFVLCLLLTVSSNAVQQNLRKSEAELTTTKSVLSHRELEADAAVGTGAFEAAVMATASLLSQRQLQGADAAAGASAVLDQLPAQLSQGGGESASSTSEPLRTATGGPINTLMIVLAIVAFTGNAAFLIYVFWLSK
jgi:hypothetical protein